MTLKQEAQRDKILTAAHHEYEKGLITHAFFKINNRAMGQDMVQDTFVKTWVYLAKGGKIDVMKAFLYHVLNNLIVDEYRRRKTTSLDGLMEKGFEPTTGNARSLIESLDGKAAMVLIARLPRAYQKVMRMRYVQDLSLKEMSFITGQSRNALAVQAHRGLEKLKVLYGSA
jgi:RNA polymerase sigma-70 factor (ECF subfamily)